jgi:hypothetical protein
MFLAVSTHGGQYPYLGMYVKSAFERMNLALAGVTRKKKDLDDANKAVGELRSLIDAQSGQTEDKKTWECYRLHGILHQNHVKDVVDQLTQKADGGCNEKLKFPILLSTKKGSYTNENPSFAQVRLHIYGAETGGYLPGAVEGAKDVEDEVLFPPNSVFTVVCPVFYKAKHAKHVVITVKTDGYDGAITCPKKNCNDKLPTAKEMGATRTAINKITVSTGEKKGMCAIM